MPIFHALRVQEYCTMRGLPVPAWVRDVVNTVPVMRPTLAEVRALLPTLRPPSRGELEGADSMWSPL